MQNTIYQEVTEGSTGVTGGSTRGGSSGGGVAHPASSAEAKSQAQSDARRLVFSKRSMKITTGN